MENKGKHMSFEEFVTTVTLPHCAKVGEGNYDMSENTDSRGEFSTGDILRVYRVVCPLVTLDFVHPVLGRKERVSVSTRNASLRFHVLQASSRPRIFRTVQEMMNYWPLLVRTSKLYGKKGQGGRSSKHDELKPIRKVTCEDGRGSYLECKVRRTNELIQLFPKDIGPFTELCDPKSYTLQEIVDMARVERTLRIDQSFRNHSVHWGGIPPGFSGTLSMKKPEALIEVACWLESEADEPPSLGAPVMVPINCDIRVSPIDEVYSLKLPSFKTYSLAALMKRHPRSLPLVVRIVDWTEISGVLCNQSVCPGDHIILYRTENVDKVLASCGTRYFLIPVTHDGCFTRDIQGDERVVMASLEMERFPFRVRFSSDNPYVNMDDLPVNEWICFEAFVKNDPCVLASKVFGNVVGDGFHLPSRTKVIAHVDNWIKNPPDRPSMMSPFDDCPEELSEDTFKEIMEAYSSTSQTTRDRNPNPPLPRRNSSSVGTIRRLPPSPPSHPGVSRTSTHSSAGQPSRKSATDKELSLDYEEYPYSYIDGNRLAVYTSSKTSYTQDETEQRGVEIPGNGNISHFNVGELSLFLKEMHVPAEVITSWKAEKINGKEFSRMSDDFLSQYGVNNTVIKFFRDKSRTPTALERIC